MVRDGERNIQTSRETERERESESEIGGIVKEEEK